jgi:hypothetical protein
MFVSIAVLALLAPAQEPNLAVRISPTVRAAPLERALEAISAESGVTLRANAAMAGEVVVLRAEDVPLEELMNRLARATSGRFERTGTTFTLVPDAATRNAEERADREQRVAQIRKSLEERLASFEAPELAGPTRTPGMPFGGFGGSDPMTALVVRFLAAADPTVLADLDRLDGRVVFSTAPTRMQRPFTRGVAGLVDALVAAQNEAAAGAERIGEANVPIPDFLREMMARRSRPVTAPVAKAILVVEQVPFLGRGFQASVRLFDAAGNVLVSQESVELGQESLEWMEEAAAAAQGQAPEAAQGSPIAWSEETKTVRDALRPTNFLMPGTARVSPEARRLLLRPDLHDPLSFEVSDALLAVAARAGRPMVAVVPDSALSPMRSFAAQTVEAYRDELARGREMRLAEESGWLVVRPVSPVQARRDRLNRRALAALLDAGDKRGVPSLDDIAAYALRAPEPTFQSFAMPYIGLFAPGIMTISPVGMTDWAMYRFYGSLSELRRHEMRQGGRIGIGQLSPEAQVHLRRMVYGANSRLVVERPGVARPEIQLPFMEAMLGGGPRDIRDEPTEIFGAGLPSAGVLEVRAASDHFVQPVLPGAAEDGPSFTMGADEMALFRMFSEMPQVREAAGDAFNFDRVRVGQRTRLDFRFLLAPGVSLERQLNDDRLPPGTPHTSIKELPPAFESRIQERLAAYRRSPLGAMAGFMGGMPGRRPTPP